METLVLLTPSVRVDGATVVLAVPNWHVETYVTPLYHVRAATVIRGKTGQVPRFAARHGENT